MDDIDDADYEIPRFGSGTIDIASPINGGMPSSATTFTVPTAPAGGFSPITSQQYINDGSKYKSWNALYPIYFNANRKQRQGRKLAVSECVESPLAKKISEALKSIGVSSVFEPDKSHPHDHVNPGRVRYSLKNTNMTKMMLYRKVAAYLRNHPTTEADVMMVVIPGFPVPKEYTPPISTKSIKLDKYLPLYSPAMT